MKYFDFIMAVHKMLNGKKCCMEDLDFEHYYYIDEEDGMLYGDNNIEQAFSKEFLETRWFEKEIQE